MPKNNIMGSGKGKNQRVKNNTLYSFPQLSVKINFNKWRDYHGFKIGDKIAATTFSKYYLGENKTQSNITIEDVNFILTEVFHDILESGAIISPDFPNSQDYEIKASEPTQSSNYRIRYDLYYKGQLERTTRSPEHRRSYIATTDTIASTRPGNKNGVFAIIGSLLRNDYETTLY